MKTRFFFAFASILTFLSCKKNITDDSLPYYQFTQDDKSKLLVSYNVGKELIYKNQNNQEIRFKIISSVNGKTSYSTGTFWGSYVHTYFYYDKQEVIMQYAEGYTSSNCDITLERYPVASDYQAQNPVTGKPAFIGYLQFPLWNSYSDSLSLDNTIFVDFNSGTTSMTINGKTYSKVRILQSGSTQILEPNNTIPLLPKNVNKIYYDENAGIIGFDDLNENRWRLQ